MTDTYTPAEDTFFLAEHIAKEKGHAALEIGTGSGYLAKILGENFSLVVATDIDFAVFKNHENRLQNSICCDGASALAAKFDLVICNLPYLPSEKIVDRAVDAGPDGLVIPIRIIKSASTCLCPGGKMLFLTSSLANYQKLMEKTKSLGFTVKVLAKKKLFFEELLIMEAAKHSP